MKRRIYITGIVSILIYVVLVAIDSDTHPLAIYLEDIVTLLIFAIPAQLIAWYMNSEITELYLLAFVANLTTAVLFFVSLGFISSLSA